MTPIQSHRQELLAEIDRRADDLAPGQPPDRDEVVLTLQMLTAKVRLGDHVRANLQTIAATALIALQHHDRLQAPAPAASRRLREIPRTMQPGETLPS